MMRQQQQQQQTLTEKAGSALRRTISALAMAALIAVVLGIMAAPAFAHTVPNSGCGYEGVVINSVPPGSSPYDRNADGVYCGIQKKGTITGYKDNHVH